MFIRIYTFFLTILGVYFIKEFMTISYVVSVYDYNKHFCSSLTLHKDHKIIVLSEYA